MKPKSLVFGILASSLSIANCVVDGGADIESGESLEAPFSAPKSALKQFLLPHLEKARNNRLTHLGGDNIKYPACIHPHWKADGSDAIPLTPTEVENLRIEFERYLNKWSRPLYRKYGYNIAKITIEVVATTSSACRVNGSPPKFYDNLEPIEIMTGPANLASGTYVQFSRATVATKPTGAFAQQVIPHEIGHMLGMNHNWLANTCSQHSVMGYGCPPTPGVGGDDIAALTHWWRDWSDPNFDVAVCPEFYAYDPDTDPNVNKYGYASTLWGCAPDVSVSMLDRRVRNKGTNKCLHVSGTSEGLDVTAETCNGSVNQEFRFLRLNNGSWKIVPEIGSSDKCLQIRGNSTAARAKIEQGACDAENAESQRFHLIPVGDGTYEIYSERSGLYVEHSFNTIHQWPANGGPYKRWYLDGE